MKKVLIVALAAFAANACSQNGVPMDAAFDLMGQYKCVSATWLGPAVDLNNDGVAGNNLKAEFAGLETAYIAVSERPCLVSFYEETCEGEVGISAPAQYLTYEKSTGEYTGDMYGITVSYLIPFGLDDSGKIVFVDSEKPNYGGTPQDDGPVVLGAGLDNFGAALVTVPEKGGLVVRISTCYFNWTSKDWVQGTMEVQYEKTLK